MTKPTVNKENLQWLLKQSTDVEIAMLESHLDICRLIVNEILEGPCLLELKRYASFSTLLRKF